MQHFPKHPKAFVKPILTPPDSVAIVRENGVGLMHVEGWMSVGEILQKYKLPYERK